MFLMRESEYNAVTAEWKCVDCKVVNAHWRIMCLHCGKPRRNEDGEQRG